MINKTIMRTLFTVALSLCHVLICNAQSGSFDYFGQTPPGDTLEIFAPGIFSIEGRREKDIAISPAGDEIFFMSGSYFPNNIIMHMIKTDSTWPEPDTAFFSTDCGASRPCFSPDGQYLYFASNRGKTQSYNYSLWRIKKSDSVWSEPESVIDMGGNSILELDSRVTKNAVYFVAEGNPNNFIDIYMSKIIEGTFTAPVKLDYPINTPYPEGGLYVDWDETYMIFLSDRFGSCGLYISYKKEDGTWTNPKDLSPKIDCKTTIVSPDGKYFFVFDINQDIYWMRTGNLIDSLKHTNFPPYVKSKIPDQEGTIGHLFSYTLPDSTFFDDDGNNTLTYSASLSNGDPLPENLTSFNPATRTFSETPDTSGTFKIKVTATDSADATVSTQFNLTIIDPSASINQIDNQKIFIYPNPTKDELFISLGNIQGKDARIKFYTLSGKTVLVKDIQNTDQGTIDISGLSKGVYLIDVIVNSRKEYNNKICLE